MRQPLLILTYCAGAGLLAVLGRYVVTGDLNTEVLTALGTTIAALIGALQNVKDDDKDGDSDGNNSA
ncbi:hypothetical protein ACFP81_06335 [Deinococcus lacus]|uniref:Holin n=1 Tax=Deinococcus lacus TaxID=392561 RepID=A0ABW1YCF9_9DEIO